MHGPDGSVSVVDLVQPADIWDLGRKHPGLEHLHAGQPASHVAAMAASVVMGTLSCVKGWLLQSAWVH